MDAPFMNRLILLAALLLPWISPFAALADEKADAPKGDLGKLQGTWTAKVGPEKNVPIVLTIQGKAVTLKITGPDGQEYNSKGEIKVDESAKPFKTIDWVKFTRPDGEEAPENLALYEFLDADTVRLCSGGPGNERPTEFKAGDGGPPNILELKRTPTPK